MSVQNDTVTEIKLKKPHQYNVIILDDNYTPMDFVVEILIEIFNKNREQAFNTMMVVHHRGFGLAGTYIREIALQKTKDAETTARHYGFPLKLKIEEAPQ